MLRIIVVVFGLMLMLSQNGAGSNAGSSWPHTTEGLMEHNKQFKDSRIETSGSTISHQTGETARAPKHRKKINLGRLGMATITTPTTPIVTTSTTPVTTTTPNPTEPPNSPCGFGEKYCVKTWECKPNKAQIDETARSDSRIKIFLHSKSICHYLEVCCKSEDIDKIPNPNDITVNQTKYGVGNPDGVSMTLMDANDNEANFGEYPWTIAIFNKNTGSYLSTGVLIHNKVVLTTALYVSNPFAKFIARAGEWDLGTTNEPLPHVEIGVKTIIRHENFSLVNLDNNIAILILEDAFEPRNYIRPICIPAVKPIENRCVTSGWTAYGDNGQHILKERTMVLLPREEQESTVLRAFGDKSKLKYAFGTPLVCPGERSRFSVDTQSLLIGLWSTESGDKSNPAVFIDTVKLKSWIEQELSNQNITLNTKC